MPTRTGLAITAVMAGLLLATPGMAEEADEAGEGVSAETVCAMVESQANARGLPADFLARLIWQESRFNPGAISPKGAAGIAQFMPATAGDWALDNRFDVPTALAASAAFLQHLHRRFGNLGLAAAAYNAGPERVRRWLAGLSSGLPRETRHYVRTITGLPVETWRDDAVEADFALDAERPFIESCVALVPAGLPSAPAIDIRPAEPEPDPIPPWGAQVAAHYSREVALASYQRLQQRFDAVLGAEEPVVVRHRAPARGTRELFAVRVGAESRARAEEICKALQALDGACLVMEN